MKSLGFPKKSQRSFFSLLPLRFLLVDAFHGSPVLISMADCTLHPSSNCKGDFLLGRMYEGVKLK